RPCLTVDCVECKRRYDAVPPRASAVAGLGSGVRFSTSRGLQMSRVNGANLRFAVAGILAIAFDGQVASAADAPTTLEEILITAEKRVGTVQETPISIAAFSGNELADRGVNDSYGLANLTPSLSVGKEFIGKVVIRGVGLEGTTVGS